MNLEIPENPERLLTLLISAVTDIDEKISIMSAWLH